MSDDRYDNLLEAAIQRCSDQIARDLERALLEFAMPKCVVCNKNYHEWQDGDEPNNHPFCRNNLEYLEWKAENH